MNNIKSSKMVADFLEKNNLHKKEFAQMIGVTLSYVYNLIDENEFSAFIRIWKHRAVHIFQGCLALGL